MKAKPFLSDEDFVVNPNGYFGSKIPKYQPCEGEYATQHGSSNYGVFRATEYVNRKAQPILDAIVTYFNSDVKDERDGALDILKEIAEQYK